MDQFDWRAPQHSGSRAGGAELVEPCPPHLHYDSATGEDTGPMPDDMGLSYSAEVWKRGDELLLAFTEHC